MSNTSTDPIADMLTRIRNGIAVRKQQILVPHSRVKESVAQILAQSGFIGRVHVEGEGIDKLLTIELNQPGESSPITEIDRLSKPGRRHYAGADDIPTVKRGRGIVVVSTSKGMMTGDEAKRQGVGGELICKVY